MTVVVRIDVEKCEKNINYCGKKLGAGRDTDVTWSSGGRKRRRKSLYYPLDERCWKKRRRPSSHPVQLDSLFTIFISIKIKNFKTHKKLYVHFLSTTIFYTFSHISLYLFWLQLYFPWKLLNLFHRSLSFRRYAIRKWRAESIRMAIKILTASFLSPSWA